MNHHQIVTCSVAPLLPSCEVPLCPLPRALLSPIGRESGKGDGQPMDGVRRHECPTISKRESLTTESRWWPILLLSGSQKRSLSLSPDKATRPGTPTRREEIKASPRLARQPVSPTGLSLASFQPSQASRNGFGWCTEHQKSHSARLAREHPASGIRVTVYGGRDGETGKVRLGRSRRRGWCGRRARGSSGWRRRRFAPRATGGGPLAHSPIRRSWEYQVGMVLLLSGLPRRPLAPARAFLPVREPWWLEMVAALPRMASVSAVFRIICL